MLAQAAFLSQGVDRHSLISIKCYKGNISSVKTWLSLQITNDTVYCLEQEQCSSELKLKKKFVIVTQCAGLVNSPLATPFIIFSIKHQW